MVSFDVESLFTNLPLEESINLAVDYIIKENSNIKLTATELKQLFTIATSETHFLFNGAYYDQIDGVAMGSPLAPILANLFMGHFENIWLRTFRSCKVLFYRRYVDDIFCLFNSESDANLFYNFINSQHPNINFTIEAERNRCLPFLDVHIDNNSQSVITKVYRKSTFTGLLTNFFSFTSFSYKLGLVRTLIDRAFKINNTWRGFHLDVKKLTAILNRNSYPTNLIESTVKQYLNKNSTTRQNSNTTTDHAPTSYFKLPYSGIFSTITSKRIQRLSKQYCNDFIVKIAFSSFKIGSWLSLKDPIPCGLRSRVVYKFSCAGCNACYVGETCRHFSTRVKEHLTRDKASHIYKHLAASDKCRSLSSPSCFSILSQASTQTELKIKEAIYINSMKPTLNQQVKHVNLKLSL